jgi:hypothetical protein
VTLGATREETLAGLEAAWTSLGNGRPDGPEGGEPS